MSSFQSSVLELPRLSIIFEYKREGQSIIDDTESEKIDVCVTELPVDPVN